MIERVYDRIGSTGRTFSDDRVVDILQREGPFSEVMVDCPLGVPPCVACERPVCPGVVACEDVGVAYMLSVAAKTPKKRRRPVNPQTQRLWDVVRQASHGDHQETTYSANMAPLVIRARTLQRRLNGIVPAVRLRETSVQHAVRELSRELGLDDTIAHSYRDFTEGREMRENFIEALLAKGWLGEAAADGFVDTVPLAVETFHAFIAAFVAALAHVGKIANLPENALTGDSSVCLPSFG